MICILIVCGGYLNLEHPRRNAWQGISARKHLTITLIFTQRTTISSKPSTPYKSPQVYRHIPAHLVLQQPKAELLFSLQLGVTRIVGLELAHLHLAFQPLKSLFWGLWTSTYGSCMVGGSPLILLYRSEECCCFFMASLADHHNFKSCH